MFPDFIDGLRVYEYTDRGDYGAPKCCLAACGAEPSACLVIGQYDGDHLYTLLWCGKEKNILFDWTYPTVEACKAVCPDARWHRKETL